MDYINTVLEKIRNCYGAYIGTKSVHRLATFLSGFECAIYELTGKYSTLNSRFQLFIEKKFNISFCGYHWSDILTLEHTDAEGFDLFFVYWDEFKNTAIE